MGSTPGAPPDQPPREGIPLLQGTTFAQERTLIGSRYVTFATEGLNPPSMLYVTADDGLYVAVANVQAGQSITLAAQFLLPDGRLQPNVWTINPPATGALTTYLYALTEGYLFNITVQPVPSTRRGVTWIYAAIRRGSLVSGNNLQTLLQDYVDTYSGPTWPGGQLRNSTDGTGLMITQYWASVPGPADFVYTVPSYARIRLRGITAYWNASATAGNRTVGLNYYDGSGNTLWCWYSPLTQAASVSYFYSGGYLLGYSNTAVYNNTMIFGLPDIILNAGQQFNFGPQGGGLAGDQAQYINLEMEQWFSL